MHKNRCLWRCWYYQKRLNNGFNLISSKTFSSTTQINGNKHDLVQPVFTPTKWEILRAEKLFDSFGPKTVLDESGVKLKNFTKLQQLPEVLFKPSCCDICYFHTTIGVEDFGQGDETSNPSQCHIEMWALQPPSLVLGVLVLALLNFSNAYIYFYLDCISGKNKRWKILSHKCIVTSKEACKNLKNTSKCTVLLIKNVVMLSYYNYTCWESCGLLTSALTDRQTVGTALLLR